MDLIQEHILAPSQVTPPAPRLNQSEPSTLLCCLRTSSSLTKVFRMAVERVSKARLAVAEAEDDLSILQQEMKGLANQIDAHHREDDVRRRGVRVGNDGMEGVFVEEANSGEEVGVEAEEGKKRRWQG